jgi:hypothetical protein
VHSQCLLTGEIPRVCPFETGFPPHATQWTPDPESWEHDPHIMDERCVAVKVSIVTCLHIAGWRGICDWQCDVDGGVWACKKALVGATASLTSPKVHCSWSHQMMLRMSCGASPRPGARSWCSRVHKLQPCGEWCVVAYPLPRMQRCPTSVAQLDKALTHAMSPST